MKSIKKLNMQNKCNGKNKCATVLEIVLFVALIAFLLLILVPAIIRYTKAFSRATEIGLVKHIYNSSISVVAQESSMPKSTIKPLHNSTDTICEISERTPFIQDILKGINRDLNINFYTYTSLEMSTPLPDNPTNAWLVFVKSDNGTFDVSAPIYIIAPETMNCYSNDKYILNLNEQS